MSDKRMLIVPAELIRKIDENRGDMSQVDFINFLIDSQLDNKVKEHKEKEFISKEEFRVFEEDTKKLLKSFLDFFVSYGLELGKEPPDLEFEKLSTKLHDLESSLGSEGKRGEAKIKWK